MNVQIVSFVNVIIAGLLAGTLLGVWLGYNPKSLSVQTYVEQQQSVINALNTLMPLIGLITILITLTAAFMQKGSRAVFVTLLVAAGLLIIAGLITKFGNQPINSIVMTWDKSNVPAKWEELRDRWWSLHRLRALAVFIAFCLITWSNIWKI